MTTLAELTTPITVDEATTAIYAALAARGVSTTTWKSGGTARTIIAGLAVILAAYSRLAAAVAKQGFLELSEGAWLDLVAEHVYGVERDLGSFATGVITLDNTGGGVYSGAAGDLVLVSPTTEQVYRNTEPFAIAALETGVEVAITAVELGSAGTAAADTITDFVTPLLGVTATNAVALIGTDPELDEALRERCREKVGTLSPNGPKDAYSYVAKSAERPDGTSIGVTRVLSVPDGIGGVDVYVADADGTITGDPEDPETDLGIVADEIARKAEPLAITARVQGATPLAVAVSYELWIKDSSGYTDAEVEALVEERLLAFISTMPIGGHVVLPDVGRVYVGALESVIGGTLPDEIIDVAVTVPASDLAVGTTEAPVLGTVIPTIVQIAGGVS